MGKSQTGQPGALGAAPDVGENSRLQPFPSPGNTADESKPNPEKGAPSWGRKRNETPSSNLERTRGPRNRGRLAARPRKARECARAGGRGLWMLTSVL